MTTTNKIQAVILAGGKGIRLKPLTNTIPKPMIRFHGKPFLEYIIVLLRENGITDILILTGYLHTIIEAYFQTGKKWGVNISYHYSPPNIDTGLRIKKAEKYIDNEFLLLYCDNYWPLDIVRHVKYFKEKKVSGMVTVYVNNDSYTKNNIFVDKNGQVLLYDKSRKNSTLNGVDIGYFLLKKKVLKLLPKSNSNFEKTVLAALIKKKQLAGYLTYDKYYGLSNLNRISTIKQYLKHRKVVFLDRDGVINKKASKSNYITSWEQFEFLPRVKEALKLLVNNNFEIYIVTNQAGIARNMLTKLQLEKIHNKMLKELLKNGVKINKIYVCPHGWNDGCFCRKPKPGLFYRAASEFYINLHKTYFIGDDVRDIQAGADIGSTTFLVDKSTDLHDIVTSNLL